uniref:Endothelial cell adhesion molecule n=1 Tax=Chelonoidis abingdonii TaxID=106734 RepID=A0A8C0H5T6_CHEAB
PPSLPELPVLEQRQYVCLCLGTVPGSQRSAMCLLKPKQLPCATHLSPDSCRTSKCIVFSSVSFQILTYMDGTVKVQETYLKNRTGFVYPMPFFNISIAINNTQEMDSGEYMCTVNILDEDTINGKNIGLINLTVLVPPSPPMCQIHGKPYLGGNVTMSCKSSFSKPSPKYTWQRTAPNTQVFFAPAQDLTRGTLMLTNLSKEMSGTYVCTAANVAGSSKCNITLEVNSPLSAAMIAGAVVGSLVGVGLIILFVLQMFVYRKKKKDTQEELANEIKEDAVAPKTPSWGKSSGSDIVSKNGTLSSVHTARDPKLYPSNRTLTPTPSLSSQSLPLYFPPGMNGSHYPSTPTVPQGLTTSTLTRMGAVPVMVPAQSQAGSLV